MKKLFSIAIMLLTVTVIGISCNNTKSEPTYASLASLVEGSSLTGNFTVVFDNGDKAYVTNAASFTFKPVLDNEARAIIYYKQETGQQMTGFDLVITLTDVFAVATDPVRDIRDSEFGDPEKYSAKIDIKEAYYGRDYVNLQVNFKYGSASSTQATHSIMLINNSNTGHEGAFKDLYNDGDGYLYLELYHNANNDGEYYTYSTYASYKIKPQNLGINLSDYVGIKILYKSMSSNRNDIYTIKFEDK